MFLISRIQSSQSRTGCVLRDHGYLQLAPGLVHIPVDALHLIAVKEDRVFDF